MIKWKYIKHNGIPYGLLEYIGRYKLHTKMLIFNTVTSVRRIFQ